MPAMPKHSLLFPMLFLFIGTPFYFIKLHSIEELNVFLANAVPKSGSVLTVMKTRRQQGASYLLQVENPTPADPARIWARGNETRLGVGDKVTFYYHPENPVDARVIDRKEISRYEMDFLFPTLILTFFVYFAWLSIEKEILEKETVYTEY
jgi:hypothetical protein